MALSSGINEEMTKMEAASRVMMAQNVDAAQRREAESYFIRLKESNISPQVCQTILQSTSDPFVTFQLAQCFSLSVARNYNTFSEQDVQEACKYLLELPVNKPDLPSYATVEIFKAAAIIYKRGKKCNSDMILTLVTELLQNPSENMQSLGLRIIEALCLEHATLWRSTITTSFQQHQVSKKRFEEHLLKKFMQLALGCLTKFVNTDYASTHATVCERFLRVAVLVLQWNFTASIVSSALSVPLYNYSTLVALRPPPTWSDLFQDEQLLPFFFELHRNVRQNSQLAHHSLSCIVQLAGVMGSALDHSRVPGERRLAQGEIQPHDLYVRRFCTALMDVFNDCHAHELHQFTTALYRIFSHHPMPIFKRFPQELLSNFIKFVVRWACQLVGPAMNQDKGDDELGMVESLSNIYYAWSVLLRSCPTFPPAIHELVMEQNSMIIETFVKTVLAPPFGQRTNIPKEDDTCDDNEEMEDHRLYGIIITDIGTYCRANIEPFIKFVINSFHERITQRQVVAGGGVSDDQRYLWFEDIHWLLLLIGSFFNDSDKDVAMYLDAAYKKGEYQRTNMHQFFLQCIQQIEAFSAPSNADPITIISGMVAHWSGILLNSLETHGANSPFVSPEICRSTLRTLASIVSFLTNLNEDQSSFFDDVASAASTIGELPSLSVQGEESSQLIDFIIRLCFAIFRQFPSEKRLCDTAVCLLAQESEKRAKFIAQSPLLYEKLGHITLERLPCRKEFMTCLVNVGSNLSTSQERSQMHDMILQPMANRFLTGAQQFQSGQFHLAPQLVDLLECFSGISKGAQIESGNILYAYLLPILHTAVRLMPLTTEIRVLSDAIMDLFKNVATTLFIFVDLKPNETVSPAEDPDNFFNVLNALFEAYKMSQMRRFQTSSALANIEEEEQIADLISLLQTISSSITKPYMLFTTGDSSDQCEALLCKKTLEMILPLLNEDVLRLPTLSNTFFRLLLNVSESSATVFMSLDEGMTDQLLKCLYWAIGGASGMEPTKLSLETIQIICRTLSMSTDTERGAFAHALFNCLAGKLFELAIHSYTSLEAELQVHAIKSLYSIIRLNPQLFNEYIHGLFSRPENAANYERLLGEYNALIPAEKSMPDTRQGFKEFNTRFERFATNTEAILVV